MPIIILNGKMQSYLLRRSRKVKRLRLEYTGCEIKIIAPYHVLNIHILTFLFQQKSWLIKQLYKTPTPLILTPNISFEAHHIDKFKKTVCHAVERYTQSLGRGPKAVFLKMQRRRWGSCGIHNQIYLNWILIFAPIRVLEYVVLHECCHLFHRNHGRHFWHLVQKHMPDYQAQEKWLRQNVYIISYYQTHQLFWPLSCIPLLSK